MARKQPILNSTAILCFANLLRKAAVDNDTAHDNYPVHVFGRMVPKKFSPLTKEYIPYLGRLLNQAIKEGDSQKIQIAVRALGNVAHPKILQFFEPYLEGQESVSDFQRLHMVSALDKMAKLYPKEARPVLFKLYQNTGESHEIRCVAVNLLMKTIPPANVIQRMAEFTNVDPDSQVVSMVQSAIKSAAALDGPYSAEL